MYKNMYRKERTFQIFANLILALLTICCVAPFILMVSASFSSEAALSVYGYTFIPKEFDISAYKYLFSSTGALIKAYGISIFVTVVGTVLNLVMTILIAYPLSRKDLPRRNIFAFYLFFTMLFNGGLIPSYIMWTRTFHIQNTIWALLIPNLMLNAYNVIMMRTYFTQSIPVEIIEAAKIDGAHEGTVLVKVIIPMAKPILATIALLVGLAYWNDWMNGLYYLTDDSMYSIQVLLTKIMRNLDMLKRTSATGRTVMANVPSTSVRMAIAFMGVLPILAAYPFFQKFLVKGITVGAVKG